MTTEKAKWLRAIHDLANDWEEAEGLDVPDEVAITHKRLNEQGVECTAHNVDLAMDLAHAAFLLSYCGFTISV